MVQRRRLPRGALERYMDGLGPGGPGAFTLCLTPGQVGDDPPVGLPEGLAEALRGQVALAASGSDTGAVLLWDPPMLRLIVPPIPVPEPLLAPGLDPGPLRTLLASAPLIAVVLVRLGRFAVGLYRGEELVESKVGGRFVKGRHRAGGSSSNRFRRIREKQADELFKAVCRTVQDRLDPFQSEIRHLFLGGERTTLLGFRGRCPYMARFDGVLRRRVLDVREPGQQALRDLPRLLWESEVFEVREEP